MKPTSSSSLTSTSQLGSGQEHPTNIEGELSTGQLLQNVSFINQVAQKVAENLTQNQLGFGSKFASINPNWKFYERAEPTVVTDGRPNTVPPLNFSVPLHETDLNDTFDEASLLKKVPKRFKDKAIQLLKKFDERQAELERLRKEVRILDEGDRILTEFRKHINSLIRPRLAELASEYLADLTDSRYTALELGDDFSPTVLEDGEPKPIISGGEQDILNLCMRLALSHMLAERAGQQFSLLILDEIFGSLDENRRGNVLSLLDKLRKRFEQILVITHLDDVKEGVQRLIQVEYDEATGASRVYDSSDAEWYGEAASNF